MDTVRAALRQRKIARLEREAARLGDLAARLPWGLRRGRVSHEATRLRIKARELREQATK